MSRYYKHKGVDLVSITTVLNAVSSVPLQWAANCVVEHIKSLGDMLIIGHQGVHSMKILNRALTEDELEAARFAYKTIGQQAMHDGTVVHNACEEYCNSDTYAELKTEYSFENVEQKNSFNSFLCWIKDYNPRIIKTEHTVYAHDCAGTLDLLCEIDGKEYVVDFKTSKGLYPTNYFQIAKYRDMVWEEKLRNLNRNKDHRLLEDIIPSSALLRLPKDGTPYEWKVCDKRHERDLEAFSALLRFYYASHPRNKAKFDKQVSK